MSFVNQRRSDRCAANCPATVPLEGQGPALTGSAGGVRAHVPATVNWTTAGFPQPAGPIARLCRNARFSSRSFHCACCSTTTAAPMPATTRPTVAISSFVIAIRSRGLPAGSVPTHGCGLAGYLHALAERDQVLLRERLEDVSTFRPAAGGRSSRVKVLRRWSSCLSRAFTVWPVPSYWLAGSITESIRFSMKMPSMFSLTGSCTRWPARGAGPSPVRSPASLGLRLRRQPAGTGLRGPRGSFPTTLAGMSLGHPTAQPLPQWQPRNSRPRDRPVRRSGPYPPRSSANSAWPPPPQARWTPWSFGRGEVYRAER